MRSSRQIPIFGPEGQKKIEASNIAVVGLGGLGCNVITQLASAGVGRLTIVDHDLPDETNLNRQFVYAFFGLDDKKTTSSKKWIEKISGTSVTAKEIMISTENVSVLEGCDVIVDCTDNIETRIVLNRFSLDRMIPIVHGGTESMFGHVSVIIPGITPCLNCFLPKKERKDIPSVGSVVSLIAAIQSTEVLKLITGTGETLAGKLLTVDAATNTYRAIDIARYDKCGECGPVSVRR
jgi:molybdopterin/thiamine biosynthesis adenylyltransferase